MEFLAANLIVFLAAAIQACTGFGFSVLATPLLLLIFAPAAAIQINLALSILISAVLLPKLWADLDRVLLRRLILGSLAGAPLGIAIHAVADATHLRKAIGVLLILFTVALVRNIRLARSRRRDYLTGGCAGALSSSLGMPGPPLMIYFAGGSMDPALLRSTTLVCFLIVYSVSLMLQLGISPAPRDSLGSALELVPATLAGVFLGQMAFRHIGTRTFVRALRILLAVTGAYLVLS
ncbi:sulfite exporter TauE/SafE family protein [Halovulum dunhuangense]|uniref:Probable membrane transporter protein n=1 Tax=Halovulum dunhuangense TaxID=1505036 RepID=A0A849L7P9_9RHOB|nr:sulfite exporter TauE/SafE family protein [Halovulum dunhuangense]NNU82077.1 sulfite exporter TauE/SafE family protein [Halovulum dunhuangense]